MTATAHPAGERGWRSPLAARAVVWLGALVAVHVAVLGGDSDLAAAFLLWGIAGALGLNAARATGRRAAVTAVVALALGALGALQAVASALEPTIALVLPPTLGNLVVSDLFAYTLLPGHEPAIVRIVRVSRGDVPADLGAYARRMTWVWAVLPVAVAAVALSALAVGGIAAWSWVANVINPILLIGTFVGEHVVRGRRFPQYGRPSLRNTLSVMLDKRAWPLPQPGHG